MKRWNLKKVIKEILIFAVLLFIASNLLSYIKQPHLDSQSLPEFSAKTIDGTTFESLHVKDKPLLIHFFATWCPTCKMENSTIDTLSKKFDVIAIVEKSGDDAKIKAFMQEHDLHFQVINDQDGTLASDFKVSGFPTSFIYSKNGTLAFSEVGYSSYLSLYIKLLYANR